MTNKQKKEGFIMRALDTVERVGNGMPDPVTLFIILVGVVIVASAICASMGVSVTYESIDTASGELQNVTVSVVNLLSTRRHPPYGHYGSKQLHQFLPIGNGIYHYDWCWSSRWKRLYVRAAA